MVDKNALGKLSITELKKFRSYVLEAETKEELLESMDAIIKEKEEQASQSLNSRFPVTSMNIDSGYIKLLHDNGIETESQLLAVDNLWSLRGMSEGAYEQISWARAFFDFTPLENFAPEECTVENAVKVIVKQANEISNSSSTRKK